MADFETMPVGTRKLFEDCEMQFRYYGDLHAAKESFEGNLKAKENFRWADKIAEHLEKC